MKNKYGELPNAYDLNTYSKSVMWKKPKILDADAIRRREKFYAKRIATQCLNILENNHKKCIE